MEIILPQVNCKFAEDFIESLSPIGQYFKEAKLSETWLFRGQGKDFPLIPSAFRKNGKFSSLTNRNIEIYGERLLAERDILIDFFNIADKRGLTLPDDSQMLRSTLETLNSERGSHFIEKGYYEFRVTNDALSLIALAQHYGIPTRLLDWTLKPYTATFFAAESATKYNSSEESSNYLVVWSFHFPLFGKHDQINYDTDPIRIVTAPTSTNPNLKAQQGLFTLLNPFYTKEGEGDYPSLEEFFINFPKEFSTNNLIASCKMRKFTLPISEAEKLLYLLAKMDITPSAIYPGYQNIIDDLIMQNTWLKS